MLFIYCLAHFFTYVFEGHAVRIQLYHYSFYSHRIYELLELVCTPVEEHEVKVQLNSYSAHFANISVI